MEQKKLSLRKETIASLSNFEQNNLIGGGVSGGETCPGNGYICGTLAFQGSKCDPISCGPPTVCDQASDNYCGGGDYSEKCTADGGC